MFKIIDTSSDGSGYLEFVMDNIDQTGNPTRDSAFPFMNSAGDTLVALHLIETTSVNQCQYVNSTRTLTVGNVGFINRTCEEN